MGPPFDPLDRFIYPQVKRINRSHTHGQSRFCHVGRRCAHPPTLRQRTPEPPACRPHLPARSKERRSLEHAAGFALAARSPAAGKNRRGTRAPPGRDGRLHGRADAGSERRRSGNGAAAGGAPCAHPQRVRLLHGRATGAGQPLPGHPPQRTGGQLAQAPPGVRGAAPRQGARFDVQGPSPAARSAVRKRASISTTSRSAGMGNRPPRACTGSRCRRKR